MCVAKSKAAALTKFVKTAAFVRGNLERYYMDLNATILNSCFQSFHSRQIPSLGLQFKLCPVFVWVSHVFLIFFLQTVPTGAITGNDGRLAVKSPIYFEFVISLERSQRFWEISFPSAPSSLYFIPELSML